MTKIEIINRVAQDTGLTKVKAELAVETIVSMVKEALREGQPVIIRRFGSFRVRHKSARIGRNPKTGQEADISARKVVRFKSGKHFRKAVNEGLEWGSGLNAAKPSVPAQTIHTPSA